MSELWAEVKGSTWLLLRRGTPPSKITEIVLLCSDGSEGWSPFSVSDYCENSKFVSMNRVTVWAHVQESKRGIRKSVDVYCCGITANHLKGISVKNGRKWSDKGITYPYATLCFCVVVLCWMNFVFKNIFWNMISGECQWNLLYC